MPDRRLAKTRNNVLETTRRILNERGGSPITFSSLAKEAHVSRQTLYTHWNSIEDVIADAVTVEQTDEKFVPDPDTTGRERLAFFLSSVRDGISQPVTTVALLAMMNNAATDQRASEALEKMTGRRMGHLAALIGPTSREIYAQLVGPIFFAEFTLKETASDELIAELVDRGSVLLGLDD